MDNQALAVYDPDEKPFGPLSNIYEDKIKVNKLYYNSVANYIYSSILKNRNHQSMIESYKNYSNIKDYAIDLFNTEIVDLDIESFQLAYIMRFSNPEFRKLLVETGNRKIEFVNSDSTFGIGDNGKGKNIIGRILMEIRVFATKTQYEIEKRQREEEEHTRIYNTYMAYIVLSNLMKNQKSDLQEYIGKNAEEIINITGKTYNPYVYSYDVVVKLYKKGFLPDGIDKLNVDIAKLARRDYILRYKYDIDAKIKNTVYNEYINHIYDSAKVSSLRDEFNRHPESSNIYFFIRDKIYDLYTKGILPAEVNDKIERKLLYIPSMPSEQEIEDAISYKPVVASIADIITKNGSERIVIEDDISSSASSDKSDDEKIPAELVELYNLLDQEPQKEEEKEPPIRFVINDPTYWYLCPVTRNRPNGLVSWFVIDNMPYPSPMDYAMMKKFSFLGNTDNVYSHGYLMIDPTKDVMDISNYASIADMSQRFDYSLQIYLENSIKKSCVIAMNDKFEKNKSLQSLLVATGDIMIEYADYDDVVLGVGTSNNGENFVGKYLMELRNRFIERGVTPSKIQPVKFMSLSQLLLNNDTKLVSWFNMRLNDLCNSIKLFTQYLYDKIEYRSREININIIRHIIYSLYNTCGYGAVSQKVAMNIQVPRQFTEMVSRSLRPLHINAKSMKEIFMYMFYLVDQLLKVFGDDQDPNIKTVGDEIANIQAGLIKTVDKKSDIVMKTKFANAVANIIRMNKYYINKYKTSYFGVSIDDINYAFKNIAPGAPLPSTIEGEKTKPDLTLVDGNTYTMKDEGNTYIIIKNPQSGSLTLKGVKTETEVKIVDTGIEFMLYKKYGIIPSNLKYIRAVFEKFGINISDSLVFAVYVYGNTLMYDMPKIDEVRKISRIAFFSDSTMEIPDDDVIQRMEDIDIVGTGFGGPMEETESDTMKKAPSDDEYSDEDFVDGYVDEEADYDERDNYGY